MLDETWGLDHYPIRFNVNVEKSKYSKKSFKIKSKKTNWSVFEDELDKQYPNFLSEKYENYLPKEQYETFVNIISALKFSTPQKHKSTQHMTNHNTPTCWWDEECDDVKRTRKAAFNK